MSVPRADRADPGMERRATRRIVGAFAASALASLGLTAVYALGGQPQIEGALLGVALGGMAVGFVQWGLHLMPQGPYVEEREPMEDLAPERDRVDLDPEGLARRTVLKRMLLAALGAFGLALLFPIRSLGPRPGRALFETAWAAGTRVVTPEGVPVTVDRLVVGGVLTVFPEGHEEAADAVAVLVRVDPALLDPEPGREDWSPEGHLVYSKLCTHAGCPVGLYEAETHQLFCPCHQSVFDVLRGAVPTAGPAARPLPQLPLEADDEGFLRARGDFSGYVGPAFWEAP